jgi:hypothetical protein
VEFPSRACQAENNAETLKTILTQILEEKNAVIRPPPPSTEFDLVIFSKRNNEPIMPESTPPKAPRLLDPDIAKLRQAHAANVLDLKRRRTSAKILQTILEKRLPALTDEDIAKLLATIGRPKPVTATVPPRPTPAAQAPRPAQPMPGAVPVMGGRKP